MSEPRELHDAPMAAELIEAVREFLERDVMASTEGRVQFHTRVAINVLGMVERELVHGPAIAAAHRERLDALGFRNDKSLGQAIRAGDLDDRLDRVRDLVYATVCDKLAVANPDYL